MEAYQDFRDDPRLAQGAEQDGEDAGEEEDEGELDDEEGESEVDGQVSHPRPVPGRLHVFAHSGAICGAVHCDVHGGQGTV